jgi:hypothetical protein
VALLCVASKLAAILPEGVRSFSTCRPHRQTGRRATVLFTFSFSSQDRLIPVSHRFPTAPHESEFNLLKG